MRKIKQQLGWIAMLWCGGCLLSQKNTIKADCTQRVTLFTTQVEPLLTTTCITCHVAGGLAETSGFVLVPASTKDALDTNLATFTGVSQIQQNGTSIVMLKPTGVIPHTGGVLAPPGSSAYGALEQMVALNGSCASGTATAQASQPSIVVPTYLPARIRRLNNAEYDASQQALLGSTTSYAASLPPDSRQANFTRNAFADIEVVTATQLGAAADALAEAAVTNNLAALAPCAGASANDATCAQTFINAFATLAYRRPITSAESAALFSVYQVGAANLDPNQASAKDPAYASGIELVVTSILQSPGFLYLTELGDGTIDDAGNLRLTPYEMASQLSYFLTGGPPDAALLQAAANAELQTPDQLAAQTTRLLQMNGGRQLAAFVEQWLAIDSLPTNNALAANMENETTAFIEEVFAHDDGTLSTLLTANYTFVDAPLAALYGLPAPADGTLSKVPLNGQRQGLLDQGSFLTTYGHTPYSSPTKRGHAIRSDLLCQIIPPPAAALMANTTPPQPTGPQTTRELYEQHMANPTCSSCHQLMDLVGFGFENFDGNGAYQTTQNGLPIDPSGQMLGAEDIAGSFSGNAELLSQLAGSDDVAQCFALNFFRFAAAQNGDPQPEQMFLNFLASQPTARRGNVPALVTAFIQSDLFSVRTTQ